MSGPFGPDPDDATPLDASALDGLIPDWIATRADLNTAEGANIADAIAWASTRRWRPEQILTEALVRDLHRRMFGRVWKWAGRWRTRSTNIGAELHQIPVLLRDVVEDARVWVEYETYPDDEIAIRTHHRMVAVHPFPNGNGRHARLLADTLAVSLGQPVFSWGATSLTEITATRREYISALQVADREYDYTDLLAFARS